MLTGSHITQTIVDDSSYQPSSPVQQPEPKNHEPERSSGFHWQTALTVFGTPFVCISFGRNEFGKLRVAKGIIAIGRFAVGVLAFGQVGLGLVALGQVGIGILTVGQLSLGLLAAVGQLSFGYIAVGQIVAGVFGLCQIGMAKHIWSPSQTDMEAVAFFSSLKMVLLNEGGFSLKEHILMGVNVIKDSFK